MINNKRVLAVIPARGGSKRIPNKNLVKINGKTLVSYSIKAALRSKYIDRLVVSSDDKKILSTANSIKSGIGHRRPKRLATDTARSVDVLLYTLKECEQTDRTQYDVIVMIQPTSPLVQCKDIDRAIMKLVNEGLTSVTTMTEISERPEWMYSIDDRGTVRPFIKKMHNTTKRSQDLPRVFRLNGAVYAMRRKHLLDKKTILSKNKLGAVIMPNERSVDIDEMSDLSFARWLIKK